MNRKITFYISGEKVKIEAQLKPAQALKHTSPRTVDLEPVPADAQEFSMTGIYDGGCGQCQDHIRAIGKGNADVQRLCDLWDRWHLNGMKSGTRAQNELVQAMPHVPGSDWYKRALQQLEAHGLVEDRGYKFGSDHLYEPLPENFESELTELLDSLKGKRLGEMPGLWDAPDVSENDDIIESENVSKRREIYRQALINAGVDPSADDEPDSEVEIDGYPMEAVWEEFKALDELASEILSDYGNRLIRKSYLEDYAREYADSAGLIDGDARWPLNHIDWKAATQEFARDFSEVEFKGVTYYIEER